MCHSHRDECVARTVTDVSLGCCVTQIYVSEPDEAGKYAGWHMADPTLPGEGPVPTKAIYNLVEGYNFNSTDIIGDVHSTIAYFLVNCTQAVDDKKATANTTTCPIQQTLS
eukprot:5308048-Pyramimonas_sp.AAC.3